MHGAADSTAPPCPYDTSVRQLEQDLGRLTLTNQVSGATEQVTQHVADAEDQSILHMTTTDPLRTPTFTDFANPTYFYQTGSCPPGSTTPGCPFVNSAFARNHGGDQPEVTTTWLGVVGPTVRSLGQTNAVRSDHTDIRPTMLSALGLQSSYVQDGRALTELMTRSAQPSGVRDDPLGYVGLAAVYKQLDAAAGQFGHDSEIVSTTAAESNSLGDTVAKGFDQQLSACQTQRDGLATTITSDLDGAAFHGQPLRLSDAFRLSWQAGVLIAKMRYLSHQSTPPSWTICG